MYIASKVHTDILKNGVSYRYNQGKKKLLIYSYSLTFFKKKTIYI